MTALLEKTNDLVRKITCTDGNVSLETDSIRGVNYAYYLSHRNGVERSGYTNNSNCTFDLLFKRGIYKATFFYKNKTEKVSFIVNFIINKYNEVVYVKHKNIIDSAEFKIDYFDNGSATTFIVFNGAQTKKTSPPFALNYLLEKGYNVVACLQNNNQYQGLSYDDFERYVAPLTNEKKVFLYGSSLGGYCSIYYAGAVNGTVIAASPRNSAHPSIIKRSKRSAFKPEDFKHSEINDNKKTDKPVFIIYDPEVKVDNFFIRKIIMPYNNKIILLDTRFSGHVVLFHINKTKQLDNIITTIVNGDFPIIDPALVSSHTYIEKADFHYREKNYDLAVTYARKALEDVSINDTFRTKWTGNLNKYLSKIDIVANAVEKIETKQ